MRATPEPFGLALRRLRERAGLTQEQLAERAGLSVRAIRALELGERRHPYEHTVRALASALGPHGEELAGLDVGVAPRGRRHQPPRLPTPLIGRDQDVRAVVDAILSGGARLLTLTGPGGVGKTRLAVAVAERLEARFTDGVAFISLAQVPSAELVLAAVGQALELGDVGAQPLPEVLQAYLRRRHLLLVLDNLEHLPAAAPLLAEMLSAAPRIVLLATSRTPLRVSGEQVHPVPPLAMSAAAELFETRAAQAAGGGPSAPEVVAEICRRLDCLPLAIELAAARVRVLPPAALLSRLDHPLALLQEGARDLPERQRTLRQTVAWSYDLLSGEEQALLRRLAAFANGWSLDDAATVAGIDEVAALGLHAALVDGSLIVPRPEDVEPRFALLETIRAYATEQLARSGEEEAVRERHAAHYLALALEAGEGIWGPDQVSWLDRLDLAHDNLRLAWRWKLARGEAADIAEICFRLWMFWWIRGHVEESRRLADEALTRAGGLGAEGRARLLFAAGFARVIEARPDDAMARLEEAAALARRIEDEVVLGWGLVARGHAAFFQRRFGPAEADFDEAYELLREQDHPDMLARLALGRSLLATAQHRPADAERVVAECQADLGDRVSAWGRGKLLSVRGRLLLSLDQREAAEDMLARAITILIPLRDSDGIVNTLTQLASAAALRSDLERAARLFGAADALGERIGLFAPAQYLELPDRCRSATSAALGPDRFDALLQEGWELSLDEVVALATPAPEGSV